MWHSITEYCVPITIECTKMSLANRASNNKIYMVQYCSVHTFLGLHVFANQPQVFGINYVITVNVDIHQPKLCATIGADMLADKFTNRMFINSHVSQHDASDTKQCVLAGLCCLCRIFFSQSEGRLLFLDIFSS